MKRSRAPRIFIIEPKVSLNCEGQLGSETFCFLHNQDYPRVIKENTNLNKLNYKPIIETFLHYQSFIINLLHFEDEKQEKEMNTSHIQRIYTKKDDLVQITPIEKSMMIRMIVTDLRFRFW